MSVALDSKHFDEVTVISIAGSVDALTAATVTEYFEQTLEGGRPRIVADLSGVDFMSSAGLRALLAALKQSRQMGGDLCLAAAKPGVERVLKMSGFTSILKTYTTVDEAVADYG
jgi:anti-anti-sigma factor